MAQQKKEETWREFDIHNDGEAENTAIVTRLFEKQDEDPFEIQTFTFASPSGGNDDNIRLELRGRSECNQSTGVALWLGAEVMGDFLLKHAELVRDKDVLEVGAGIGLCGILAHYLGAKEVILTDGDVHVLDNLEYNVERNRKKDHPTTLECTQLIWGHELAAFREAHGRKSVLIGADVVYMRQSLEALWKTIDGVLELNGKFIYVGRSASQASLEEVLDMASRFEFTWTKSHPEGVFIFTRNNSSQEKQLP